MQYNEGLYWGLLVTVPHFALLRLRSRLCFYGRHFLKFMEENIDIDVTWFLLPTQDLSVQSSVLLKSDSCPFFFSLNPAKSEHAVYTGKIRTTSAM